VETCWHCGGDIEIRYVNGVRTPIHLSGGCSGLSGLEHASSSSYADDFCRRITCAYCGERIFFVRHNGGSVWFDELGWPWDKHPCYYPPDMPVDSSLNGFFDLLGRRDRLLLVVFGEPVSGRRTQLTAKAHDGTHLQITVAGDGMWLVGTLVRISEDDASIVSLARPKHKVMIVEKHEFGSA
jgi:hypothetical protein